MKVDTAPIRRSSGSRSPKLAQWFQGNFRILSFFYLKLSHLCSMALICMDNHSCNVASPTPACILHSDYKKKEQQHWELPFHTNCSVNTHQTLMFVLLTDNMQQQERQGSMVLQVVTCCSEPHLVPVQKEDGEATSSDLGLIRMFWLHQNSALKKQRIRDSERPNQSSKARYHHKMVIWTSIQDWGRSQISGYKTEEKSALIFKFFLCMQANFEACICDKSIIIFADYLVLKDQWWVKTHQ